MSLGPVHQPAFGQRLKRLRQEKGLSQRDVAGDVVNPSYVSLLESGARVPTLEVVVRLADKLEVSPDELLGTEAFGGDRGGSGQAKRLVHDLVARSSIDYGNLAEAQQRYESAFRESVETGATLTALDYGVTLQDILNVRGSSEERYVLLHEMAGLAETAGIPEFIVKVDVELASAARELGYAAEGVQLAERAVGMVGDTQLAGTPEQVRALGVLVSVRCDYGDIADVPGLIKQLIEAAERLERSAVTGHAHWVAAVACARIGQPQQAVQHIRQAKGLFATPATPLHEWARFSRAAASTLLEADADLAEIEQFLRVARTTLEMVALPGEESGIAVLEARFALRAGDPAKALELAAKVPADLADSDRVRLLVAKGRAHAQLGEYAEAAGEMRTAAALAEELGQFRLATRVWRELDEVRSAAAR